MRAPAEPVLAAEEGRTWGSAALDVFGMAVDELTQFWQESGGGHAALALVQEQDELQAFAAAYARCRDFRHVHRALQSGSAGDCRGLPTSTLPEICCRSRQTSFAAFMLAEQKRISIRWAIGFCSRQRIFGFDTAHASYAHDLWGLSAFGNYWGQIRLRSRPKVVSGPYLKFKTSCICAHMPVVRWRSGPSRASSRLSQSTLMRTAIRGMRRKSCSTRASQICASRNVLCAGEVMTRAMTNGCRGRRLRLMPSSPTRTS